MLKSFRAAVSFYCAPAGGGYDVVPRQKYPSGGLNMPVIPGELGAWCAGLTSRPFARPAGRLGAALGVVRMTYSETDAVLTTSRDFLGALIPVWTGCRLVAEGKA